MDYAKWIPSAGGYVYNGQVISQKPIYDANGKQVVDVTMEQINSPSNTSQTVNANNVQNQTGATVSQTATANKPNTNMQTAIGSLGTTNNNTTTSGTAVSSPATNSPQTNVQAQDPVQKYITDYSTALANQDLNGQINALIELDKYTVSQGGVPQYSEVIGNLQKQNTEQVTNTVNEYAMQIAEATRTGNTALANGLQQELASFKQQNDYASVLQNRKAEIETEYSFAYMQGINDITNGILSLLGQYGNFQYDPYSDPALQMAQGYAVSSIKEQMNSTGMYYSSMTQSAITRAINELIPVYEQMAKDEILQNINLLQSTASYLLNLEQAQFDMWASQIELQMLKNQERREEIQHAWDRVNNLGYVDNEASLILGVDVGTLSPEIRKAIMAEEAELRKIDYQYKIDKKLEAYKKDLEIEKAQAEYNLATYGTTDKELIESGAVTGKPLAGTVTSIDTLKNTAKASAEQGVSKYDIFMEIKSMAKTEDVALNAIKQAKDVNGEYIFDTAFINDNGLDVYETLLELEAVTKDSGIGYASGIMGEVVKQGTLTDEQAEIILTKYIENTIALEIEEMANGTDEIKGLNQFEKDTKNTVEQIEGRIMQLADEAYAQNGYLADGITTLMYQKLFDMIANAEKFDFPDGGWFNQGAKAKNQAMESIINNISSHANFGTDKEKIVKNLQDYQKELQEEGKIK